MESKCVVVHEPEAVSIRNDLKEFKTTAEMVEYLKDKINNIRKMTIHTSWEIGGYVKRVIEDANYGDCSMDKLEEELQLSKSSLYGYKSLYEQYTALELENKILNKNISWHCLYRLLSVKDADERDRLIDKLHKGEIKVSDLGTHIPSADVQEAIESEQHTTGVEKAAESECEDSDKTYAKEIRKALGKADVAISLLADSLDMIEGVVTHFSAITNVELYDALKERAELTSESFITVTEKMAQVRDSIKNNV